MPKKLVENSSFILLFPLFCGLIYTMYQPQLQALGKVLIDHPIQTTFGAGFALSLWVNVIFGKWIYKLIKERKKPGT